MYDKYTMYVCAISQELYRIDNTRKQIYTIMFMCSYTHTHTTRGRIQTPVTHTYTHAMNTVCRIHSCTCTHARAIYLYKYILGCVFCLRRNKTRVRDQKWWKCGGNGGYWKTQEVSSDKRQLKGGWILKGRVREVDTRDGGIAS